MAGVMRGVLGIGSKVASPMKSQARGMLSPTPPLNPLTKAEVYIGGFLMQVVLYIPSTYVLSQFPTYGKYYSREDRI